MEDNLKEFLKREKEFRDNKNYYGCFITCLKIIDEIQSKNENTQFEIISKIFLYSNQSNFVKIFLFNTLIQNTSIINNINIKRKYYQLLIDSFNKGKDKEYNKEINQIKKLYEKSQSNDFIYIDEYISNVASDISNKSNNLLETINSTIGGDSSIFNLKGIDLIGNNNLKKKYQPSLEIINSENISEKNSTVQETFSNINNKEKIDIIDKRNLLKKYSPNKQLPMIIISVSVHLNSNQFLNLINDHFEKINYVNSFTIKNTERDNIRIYEYHTKNCINNIFSNFICKNKNSKIQFYIMTLLKRDLNNFNMGINSFLNDTYERRISIKTIQGNQKDVIKTIIKFLKNYCLDVEKIKIIKQSKCFLNYNLDETLRIILINRKIKKYNKIYSKLITSEDSGINFVKKNNSKIVNGNITLVEKNNDNAGKYYELYKIFSNEEYGLGKTMSEFIEDFKKEYTLSDNNQNKIKEINTRIIMMKIVNIIEESTNTLNSTFNYDDENLEDKAAFFSRASEQFILNKIYSVIYNIYNIKYKKDNEKYLHIKKEINNKLSINEICDKIGVKSNLRGEEKIPFNYVIDILNKIPLEKSLKKKFEAITQASLELRNCILDYTNGKYELDSMDDELPIIIYIVTQLNVNNLFAEIYMVDDYLKCSLRDETIQNKMIFNLLGSLLYISSIWKSEN